MIFSDSNYSSIQSIMEKPTDYRLPTNVAPGHYDLTFKTDLEVLKFLGRCDHRCLVDVFFFGVTLPLLYVFPTGFMFAHSGKSVWCVCVCFSTCLRVLKRTRTVGTSCTEAMIDKISFGYGNQFASVEYVTDTASV